MARGGSVLVAGAEVAEAPVFGAPQSLRFEATGFPAAGQTVTKALPASAQTPGSVFIVSSAAAAAQSTALPPASATSAAASAASSDVVAIATLVMEC